MKPSTLPLYDWKSGIIRVDIFVLIWFCPDVSCIDGDTEQEQPGESWSHGMDWFSLCWGYVLLFLPSLPISFEIPIVARVPCSPFVWLEVCGVNWNCSEGSPSASYPISDLISGLPTHKVGSPQDTPCYKTIRSSIPVRVGGRGHHVTSW